jgi:allophanate hydrolase subunit 2
VLGSNATHTRSSLGGIDGRALAIGDVLLVRDLRPSGDGAAAVEAPWLDRNDAPIRIILGPQHDYFSNAQIEAFCREPWTVSHRSDRMAYFLEGPKISPEDGLDIVSDGIVMGAIQVLGDGRPMVLMADRQVTGGYPKIATVIGPDLGRFAQARPGSQIRFETTTIDMAVASRRAEAAMLASPIETTPLVRNDLSAELLLGSNLISGVTGERS